MTKERLLYLSGQDLFQRQLKALRKGRITFAHLRATSAAWLRQRGYVQTSLGWWKPEELDEMGAIQSESGEWKMGAEERRRTVGKDNAHIKIYSVPVRANAFFARRRAENAKFMRLLSAAPSLVRKDETASGADIVAYARDLFGSFQ